MRFSTMSKFKVLALAATFVVATAGLAIAGGDCGSKASAETAAAKTASAEGCASKATAETAAAKTASAEGCASKATAETAAAKTASAGACGSSASTAAVKTAGAEGCSSAATAQTAGAGCSSEAKAAAQTVQIETVRMPSGAMAVFYNGTNAETVAFLQSKASEGCSGFVCDMAKGMAADENVVTEIAATEHGVMILVTSAEPATVDKYEEQYAAVVASMDDEQGE
jgi:hypothetical protein